MPHRPKNSTKLVRKGNWQDLRMCQLQLVMVAFFLICAVFGQELLMDVHQQLAILIQRAEELSEGVFHGSIGNF